jgi:NAD(P)-dependent dehydrogenase (short-subunit alcohol dehydrogenase family)
VDAGTRDGHSTQLNMAKRAVITGITGQDGSYLAELLLEHGYEVTGVVRRSSSPNLWRIEHLLDRIELRPADLLDQLSLMRIIADVKPREFYNLAAMSFVPASWDQPLLTGEFNSMGVTRTLEAIRQVDPSVRLYQASSSEMYGRVREVPQTELTPFYPRSPYGVSKVFGHYITVNYRESYGMFAVSGILFNHESPRRGLEFVTRKVTQGVAAIKLGLTDHLSCRRLRAGDVVDDATGQGRRLRHRDGCQPLSEAAGGDRVWSCRVGLAAICAHRSEAASAGGSRPPDWRCNQGEADAWMGTDGHIRPAGGDDGRRRSRPPEIAARPRARTLI